MTKIILSEERDKMVSLLVDAIVKRASPDEIDRVTKHSLAVIDAEKLCRRCEQSYIDNGIAELELKYHD